MPDISSAIRPAPAFVEKIFRRYEETRTDWRRPHLGASLIGTHCRRSLWFSFRWALAPDFPGRVLRLFDTGNLEEGRIVRDLRNAGHTVFDRDPETGKQFNVTLNAHSGGSLDGIGCGFEESPKKWHVLEFKTHNAKSFAELKAKGVEKAKPLHFAQMQIYMYKMNQSFPGEFDRAMYIAVNKDTDDIYGERVKLDHMTAQGLVGKASDVVDSARPAPRLSDDPRAESCLFCQYHGLCFGNEWRDTGAGWAFVSFSPDKIERNCRTCLHSTPCPRSRPDGTGVWECSFDDSEITAKGERAECVDHLFHPDLLRSTLGEVVDASKDFVKYDRGINYKGGRIEKY